MARDPDEAEIWLDSLAEVGWQPGLERIERLCDLLGRPQDEYRSIHVVGTNGKTSVTRSAGTILSVRGVGNGCITSPHFEEWSERVMVDDREVDRTVWAGAVARVREVVPEVESGLPDAGRVTQFEASVASELLTLAESGVDVAVVEAGLGGRLDATNVLASEVVVLTSVGLDHTEWLGETEIEIAMEKLAVVDPGATLVTGPLDPPVAELARRVAAEGGGRLIEVTGEGAPASLAGPFRRLAFDLAEVAIGELIGPTDQKILSRAARGFQIPGRLESLGGDPEMIFDVAHNPDGIVALGEALPEVSAGRPVVAVFGVLSDKDRVAMVEALAGITRDVFFCRPVVPGADASGREVVDPAELAGIARQAGIDARVVDDPGEALGAARTEASEMGGIVLVCGTHLLRAALQG